MRILTVLGMNDRRLLTFSGKNIYYDFPKELVMFEGEDSQQIIQCAISKMALDDYFNGRGKDPLKAFQAQHEAIEHAARRKYLSGNLEAPNFILLKVSDFEY